MKTFFTTHLPYPLILLRWIIFFCGLPALFLAPRMAFSTHIVGAELYYRCIDAANNRYEVTLIMYRDCLTGEAPFDDPITLFAFRSSNPSFYTTHDIPKPANTPEIVPENWEPCVGRPYDLCVEKAIYKTHIILPPVAGGYDLGWARCCRNASITNLLDPLSQGVTFSIHVPGPEAALCNSSPVFKNELPLFICAASTFSFDHSALDPDGDSLVYSLSNPNGGRNFAGLGVGDCNNVMIPPVVGNTGDCPGTTMIFNPLGPPPYQTVIYASGQYNSQNPFGPGTAAIDPHTGFLTFTPPNIGIFVVAVSVKEYRNGIFLSENKKDFQIHVINCLTPGQPPDADHDLSVIDSLEPGLSVSYGNGDTVFAIAGTMFCYNATVWDTNLTDSLISFPVSDVFGSGSSYFPPAATITQVNTGYNPIELQICWQPACEYIGDTLPLLIGGRDRSGCTNHNYAYDTVLVVVKQPPIVAPKVGYTLNGIPSIGDTIILRVDSSGCFHWWVTDSLHTGHLNYATRMEAISGGSPQSPQVSLSKFTDSLALRSCITPDCNMMGGLFLLILEGNDNSVCPPDNKDLDTVYLKVPNEPNPPPVISHDLAGNLLNGDTILVDVHDLLCYRVFIEDTFPAHNITWSADLFPPVQPYSGPLPQGSELSHQNDSLVLRICWTPNCEGVGGTFLIRVGATQENACGQLNTVYDSVYVHVNDVINPPPQLSHTFLPGYMLVLDTLNVAADSSVCFGFEISDSGLHTFLELLFSVTDEATGLSSGHTPSITYSVFSDTLIRGTFCMVPGCGFSGALLKVSMSGRDTFDCNTSNHVFDSLFIRVNAPFNQIPVISHNLGSLPDSAGIVQVHPEGRDFCYTVTLYDPDGSLAELIASGNSAVFQPDFPKGNPATWSVSGTNPLEIEVCWNPSCYQKNQSWELVMCGRDTSRCGFTPGVCDTVIFQILNCSASFQNIFSPNADGINDLFVPYDFFGVRYYHLQIFDRWGYRVFDSMNQGWDGKTSTAKDAPEGVYYWTVEYEYWSAEGKPLIQHEVGNVTLMR